MEEPQSTPAQELKANIQLPIPSADATPMSDSVQCVVGGTNMDSEIKRMKRTPPHILVATPGRLVDHLQNQGASQFMSNLNTLVFDEADRLLDMGFRYPAHTVACKAGYNARLLAAEDLSAFCVVLYLYLVPDSCLAGCA